MSSTKFSRIHEEETQWLPFLKKALEPKHVNYNDEIKLLRTPFTSPGYHTKLRNVENVHPIRESLDYAWPFWIAMKMLIKIGRSKYCERFYPFRISSWIRLPSEYGHGTLRSLCP